MRLREALADATASCPFLPARFYRVSEVAEAIGVSRKTIWAWVKARILPPLHGACRRFRGDQLAQWAEMGKPWRDLETTQYPKDEEQHE